MRQIRNGVFETNSSSVHSIAIPRSYDNINYISFHIDEFGWEWREVDPANYFYTAIYETSNSTSEVKEKIEKLKSILDSRGIEYRFGEVEYHIWHSDYANKDYLSLDYGYIDHGNELTDFVDELLNDGDKLVRFLSRGLVFTGNDNSDAENRCFIERDQEFLDDYDWQTKQEFKIENPYYMSDHEDYEWYWKGN
jgi:hypothetical protein